MPRLGYDNATLAPCVPASSTSVGAQCRRQTDTSIFSIWACHTDVAGPALAAVSRTHRLQAGCARLSMTARSGAMVSLRSHPMRRWFQPPPSPVVVFLAASDPTYTAVYCRRSCVSGGSGTVCHLSSRQLQRLLFFGTASRVNLFPDHFPHNCFLHLVLYTVFSSGLAVLYFRPL